ncbi:hypothetical protein K443DRAFT_221852 [Laccaria amethystina LaAM-08-1]|uniref:Unplaced genomic scaffold K443scaffold_142, whole genome shotgun sequence n=1 Tax=Laccaria amethystina LaAM-08-1 TaxID=1095629 RepID=A0A0C9WME4_9AGAR|nr:hypothetical protein K443DRAFT_221852 [Laccaria amethystina LaAM-08-1]
MKLFILSAQYIRRIVNKDDDSNLVMADCSEFRQVFGFKLTFDCFMTRERDSCLDNLIFWTLGKMAALLWLRFGRPPSVYPTYFCSRNLKSARSSDRGFGGSFKFTSHSPPGAERRSVYGVFGVTAMLGSERRPLSDLLFIPQCAFPVFRGNEFHSEVLGCRK